MLTKKKFKSSGNTVYQICNNLLTADTYSGFEAAKTVPWPSQGLHHLGEFLYIYSHSFTLDLLRELLVVYISN